MIDRQEEQPMPDLDFVFSRIVHPEIEDTLAERLRLPLGHRFGGLHTPVDEVL